MYVHVRALAAEIAWKETKKKKVITCKKKGNEIEVGKMDGRIRVKLK